MKTRLTGILAAAALAVATVSGPVAADAELGEHNCGGWAYSSAATGGERTIGEATQEFFDESGAGSFEYHAVGHCLPPA